MWSTSCVVTLKSSDPTIHLWMSNSCGWADTSLIFLHLYFASNGLPINMYYESCSWVEFISHWTVYLYNFFHFTTQNILCIIWALNLSDKISTLLIMLQCCYIQLVNVTFYHISAGTPYRFFKILIFKYFFYFYYFVIMNALILLISGQVLHNLKHCSIMHRICVIIR